MPYPYYQNYPNYNQLFYQQMQQQQQTGQSAPQIQNGGFVIVKDINEARNYAVAPGNSVTFKVESQPYICTKTLGFSQLDQPIFEVFKLVKEDNAVTPVSVPEEPIVQFLTLDEGNVLKTEIEVFKSELTELKAELTELKKELGGCEKAEVITT